MRKTRLRRAPLLQPHTLRNVELCLDGQRVRVTSRAASTREQRGEGFAATDLIGEGL